MKSSSFLLFIIACLSSSSCLCAVWYSLNVALYDDERGYPDAEAQYVDEQIYAFIDDDFFKLNYNDFIQKAKQYLD